MYCNLEFKLCYHKNLKLFSIRVKENIWTYSFLRKQGDKFLLFLKVFSWETDLWVMLGEFTVKKCKIGKGNLYLIENWLSWNDMRCAAANHNYMCHTCAKEFLHFELQSSSYWQNIKFSWNCPRFHIFSKIIFLKVFLQLFRPTVSFL